MNDEQWKAGWNERNQMMLTMTLINPDGAMYREMAAKLNAMHEQRRVWLHQQSIWNEPCFAAWRDSQ
jgi:hypothetical protein